MSKPKPGPRIGQASRTRKKNHQKFRGHRTRTVGRAERKLGGCVITKLQVKAVYHQILRKLMLNISGPSAPGNRGPGISLRESYDWKRDKNADGSVHRLLKKRLDELEKQIRGKAFPEKDMFLELCCSSKDSIEFMESVCSSCTCWYCELSPAE